MFILAEKTYAKSFYYDIKRTTAKEIDDLTYVYDGNQLQTVTDAKNNPSGYPAGGNVFEYDLNGSMTKQQDKGISNITYNLLDLPSTVTHTNGTIQYLYRADGTKLKKTASGATTDYVDGFQYEKNILKFVPTSEGYFNFENNTYIYHYTDHLGNIRLSYTKNGSSAAIIEESNFYPYGMKQENTIQTNPAYNYEQSGKEYQKETGWSDFGARMYMADIGRWGVIDVLAETTRRINPYNYALDNPVSYVDPDGRKAVAPSSYEALQPLNGLFGYMTGGGRATFGSFEEFLGLDAPRDLSLLGGSAPSGGGGGGFSLTSSNSGNSTSNNTNVASGTWINGMYIPNFNEILLPTLYLTGSKRDWLDQIQEEVNKVKASLNKFMDRAWQGKLPRNGFIDGIINNDYYDLSSLGLEQSISLRASRLAKALENKSVVNFTLRDADANPAFRTKVNGSWRSTSKVTKASKVLKGIGTSLAVAGIAVSIYEVTTGQISKKEFGVDMAFTAIGFAGPIGATISLAYFGSKAFSEYYGYEWFDKPN